MDPWWRFLTSLTSIRFRLRCTPSEDGLPSDRLPLLLLRALVLSAPARAPVSSAPRLSTTCFFIEHFSQLYVTMYPVTMLSDDDVRGYVTWRWCSMMMYIHVMLEVLLRLWLELLGLVLWGSWCRRHLLLLHQLYVRRLRHPVFLTSRRLRHSAINLYVLQTPFRLRHTVVLCQYFSSTTLHCPRHPAAQSP